MPNDIWLPSDNHHFSSWNFLLKNPVKNECHIIVYVSHQILLGYTNAMGYARTKDHTDFSDTEQSRTFVENAHTKPLITTPVCNLHKYVQVLHILKLEHFLGADPCLFSCLHKAFVTDQPLDKPTV